MFKSYFNKNFYTNSFKFFGYSSFLFFKQTENKNINVYDTIISTNYKKLFDITTDISLNEFYSLNLIVNTHCIVLNAPFYNINFNPILGCSYLKDFWWTERAFILYNINLPIENPVLYLILQKKKIFCMSAYYKSSFKFFSCSNLKLSFLFNNYGFNGQFFNKACNWIHTNYFYFPEAYLIKILLLKRNFNNKFNLLFSKINEFFFYDTNLNIDTPFFNNNIYTYTSSFLPNNLIFFSKSLLNTRFNTEIQYNFKNIICENAQGTLTKKSYFFKKTNSIYEKNGFYINTFPELQHKTDFFTPNITQNYTDSYVYGFNLTNDNVPFIVNRHNILLKLHIENYWANKNSNMIFNSSIGTNLIELPPMIFKHQHESVDTIHAQFEILCKFFNDFE